MLAAASPASATRSSGTTAPSSFAATTPSSGSSRGCRLVVRRGRGFVPDGIDLPREVPSVLATGAYLKNAVCLTRGSRAYLSQHLGDMDSAETYRFFEESIRHLETILDVEPVAVAHDLHPDFLSTEYAQSLGIRCVPVQHHHAHIAAVLVEHGLSGPHLGLALDGIGLGPDGTAWGGELLRVDGARFDRVGHLAPLPLPGGDVAAREPWRMAVAALWKLGLHSGDRAPMGSKGSDARRDARGRRQRAAGDRVRSLVRRRVRPPRGARSLRLRGRGPDGAREPGARPRVAPGAWRVEGGVLDLLPLLDAMRGMTPEDGADAFHGTLAAALVDLALPALGRSARSSWGGAAWSTRCSGSASPRASPRMASTCSCRASPRRATVALRSDRPGCAPRRSKGTAEMCLAVPAKVVSLNEDGTATVSIGGLKKSVSLALVDGVEPG